MDKIFIACLFLVILPQSVFCMETQTRVGSFFKIGEKSDKPIFFQTTKVEITDDLNRKTDSEIVDDKGLVIMKETAVIENGLVQKQIMDQLQIKERYELLVKDNKVQFKTYDRVSDQEFKLKDESQVKFNDSFYMGPSLEIFLKKSVAKFNEGLKLTTEFGIFEIQKFLNFNFKKIDHIFKNEKQDGIVAIQMKINNVLFSLFADPLYLEVDQSTGRLVRYRGRTPVRILQKDKLIPFDADIYYEVK